MRTYTVRINSDQGIIAITTAANDWLHAVIKVLSSEGAPSSAYRNCFEHFEEGDTVWNGSKINKFQADAYNHVNDRVHAWEAINKEPPENLLNGRHNILANVA